MTYDLAATTETVMWLTSDVVGKDDDFVVEAFVAVADYWERFRNIRLNPLSVREQNDYAVYKSQPYYKLKDNWYQV